jgi:hypothetical protein
MLSSKNIKTLRPKKKLDDKYLGPFTITKAYSPLVYKLKLPSTMQAHPVFHISLLEKYTPSKRFMPNATPKWNRLNIRAEDVYVLDHILDKRRNNEGLWEYKIRWGKSVDFPKIGPYLRRL